MREERERLYRSLGMQRIVFAVAADSELESAVAEAARQRVQALLVGDEPMFYSNRFLLMRAALRHALPTIVPARDYVEAGGLLSLAIDDTEGDRVFAYFVDKILRGPFSSQPGSCCRSISRPQRRSA
jgi:putative ABC transport system substrate-binding protein